MYFIFGTESPPCFLQRPWYVSDEQKIILQGLDHFFTYKQLLIWGMTFVIIMFDDGDKMSAGLGGG